MFAIRSAMRLAVTAMASGLITLALAAHANTCDDTQSAAKKTPASTATCEQARQFAWFMRQLALTDGDTDPSKVETPEECKR